MTLPRASSIDSFSVLSIGLIRSRNIFFATSTRVRFLKTIVMQNGLSVIQLFGRAARVWMRAIGF